MNVFSFCAKQCTLALALCLLAATAQAQFAAAVTPPRFEFSVEPGQTSRQVLEITHALPGSGMYRVYTADWTMNPSGVLDYYEALQPGSCRPWVAIERHDVTVRMGSRVRFRFEVAPPASVTPRECRFAIMLESKPQDVQGATATFPMSGRIGVIVYARVGAVHADLQADSPTVGPFDGRPTPMVLISNRGLATGRLAGIVQGRDASGATFELSPDPAPILPGQSRRIALQRYEGGPRAAQAPASSASGAGRTLSWPLLVKGALEYEGGAQRLPLDFSFIDAKSP